MEPPSDCQTVGNWIHSIMIDNCVFYRGDTIFIVYVDNMIFIGDTGNQILAIRAQIQGLGLKIEDQGHPAGYV